MHAALDKKNEKSHLTSVVTLLCQVHPATSNLIITLPIPLTFHVSHYQVHRAELRLKGIQTVLSLVHKDHLIPSVKYSLLSGWQGLLTMGNKLW